MFGICFESERERNRRRLQAIVCDHHLKQVKEFLLYNELAIWRRENGFDRVMEGKESCFYHVHHSLPPTPEEYYASLWLEVDALKDAISIPAESRPRQKDSMDELLAKFEYAEIKIIIPGNVHGTSVVQVVPLSTLSFVRCLCTVLSTLCVGRSQ